MDITVDISKVVLETDRLLLRGWREKDVDDFSSMPRSTAWGKWPGGNIMKPWKPPVKSCMVLSAKKCIRGG